MIRTTRPTNGNKYYNTKSVGGYSTCIVGKPTDPQCNVLSNCVGYACGAFNEELDLGYEKYHLNCNAENFIERAVASGLSVSKTPVLGSIICWEGKGSLAGHVAIVINIKDSNCIETAESSYGSSIPFKVVTRYNNNGRWGMNENYPLRGFIINPNYPPQPTPTYKYKVGDVVNINGVYVSSTSTEKLNPLITRGTITRIVEGARNPYLLDDGGIGWVNDDCIVDEIIYKTVVNCYWLNLRTSPSYGNNIYTSVQKGTKLEYLGMENGWAKVKYQGKTLYCGEQYLK